MGRSELLAEELAQHVRGGWPGSGQLPGVREIAREYHASAGTVLGAIRHLIRKGLVVQVAGGRRFAVAGSRPAVVANRLQPHVRRSHEIALGIRQDILAGQLSGALPSVKEYVTRFGCGFRTLRVALEELVTQGYIESRGRGYAVTTSAGVRATRGSSVYIAGMTRVAHSYPHAIEFLQAVEKELANLRWRKLEYLLSNAPETMAVPGPELTAGFIHFPSGHDWGEFFWHRCRAPVVLVNLPERPGFSFPGRPRSFQISPDNRKAGREVGLYLKAGKRDAVAFLTHEELKAHPWPGLRYDGLREVFPGAESIQISGKIDPAHQACAVSRQVDRLQKTVLHTFDLPHDILVDRLSPAYEIAGWCEMMASMGPVFNELLKNRRIRAWVCANDSIAVMALSFIKNAGKRCPDDIAVVGFDNSALSYRMNLTSYDFGIERMGHLAVRYLACPREVSGGLNAIRVSGRLVKRATTPLA